VLGILAAGNGKREQVFLIFGDTFFPSTPGYGSCSEVLDEKTPGKTES
jgi:hypothetical protein